MSWSSVRVRSSVQIYTCKLIEALNKRKGGDKNWHNGTQESQQIEATNVLESRGVFKPKASVDM